MASFAHNAASFLVMGLSLAACVFFIVHILRIIISNERRKF